MIRDTLRNLWWIIPVLLLYMVYSGWRDRAEATRPVMYYLPEVGYWQDSSRPGHFYVERRPGEFVEVNSRR